jgi:uncharacterized protein YjbI with pentapeptide repeats
LAITTAKTSTDRTIDVAHEDVLRTLDATREGQIFDLNSRAIDQLGSQMLDARIGGIYALERVARDSIPDHPTVMEVLCAFIREHSHEQWPKPAADETEGGVAIHTTRPDVQAALTVIGRRDRQQDRWPIDLAGADLARANLTGADMTGANIAGADLTDADLARAIFTDANLSDSIFTDANLRGAHLTDAHLTDANLTRANLTRANLERANLTRANLERANLHGATLRAARLTAARLTGALLLGADFTEAYLADAELAGAYVTAGHVAGVGRVTGPNFTRAKLAGATWQADTPVPDGWIRGDGSGRLRQANIDTDDAGS